MSFNLDNVVGILRARGLKVVETAGWITRGYAGQDLQGCAGVLWHHTATNRAAFNGNNAPTLQLCINGRSDLAGPLANIVLGRDGTVYMVATGVANHAGTGNAYGVPVNAGNHWLIGIEMESSGVYPWDWTPAMLSAAPKLGAALELAYLQSRPAAQRLQLGHMEYSDAGKIDPAGWPGGMDGLRASINRQIAAWSKAPDPAPSKPATSKPKPAPAKPAPGKYVADWHWTMESGETLTDAVNWMNKTLKLGTTVAKVAAYNGIKNPNQVKKGELIWPPTGRGVWTVDPGDNMTKIVKWWGAGLTIAKMQSANGINNPNKLPPVGTRLQVPK